MQKLHYFDIFQKNNPFFIADTVFASTAITTTHTHDFYEIFLVREGELIHSKNNMSVVLREGDLCFIHPDDFHWFQSKDPGAPAVITNLAFTLEEFARALMYLGKEEIDLEGNITVNRSKANEFISLIELIYKKPGLLPGNDNTLLFRELLIRFLISFLLKPDSMASFPEWLSRALNLMEKPENLRDGIPRFVEISGKTQEHLTRTLRKYLDITPSEFVNDLRLQYASRLLRSYSAPVKEIVDHAGYENPAYFNRLFKQKFGVSPKKYRLLNVGIVNPGTN